MPRNAIPRYQDTYRADEIDLVIRLARRGESLGFVGIAGVGKSNVVNFLRDIQRNLGQDVEQLHFPIVDATQWQGTPVSLWKLMLAALNQATEELLSSVEDNKIIPISEEERVLNTLQERLKGVCQKLGHQVMFILDDFDRVLEVGPLSMLEQLNGLRSGGNREFLSYLVFTKRLPHILGQSHPLENESKFYDLFRPNIYALEPYSEDDAMQMLKHLDEVAGDPLSEEQLKRIFQFAGGHARLLRLVFNISAEEGVSGIGVTNFANKPDVKQECKRILLSLHEQEQEVALQVAQGSPKTEHEDTINHLMRRGVLVNLEPAWFSLVFGQFLKDYEQ